MLQRGAVIDLGLSLFINLVSIRIAYLIVTRDPGSDFDVAMLLVAGAVGVLLTHRFGLLRRDVLIPYRLGSR